MKVSDLAAELEVPASTVLDQCQRFGIDASWAGAELSGSDVVVLRAELASGAPIDLTPADPAQEPVVVAASAVPAGSGPSPSPTVDRPAPEAVAPADADEPESDAASLPPTAVGSMPDVAAELTPEPDPEPGPSAPWLPGGHQGAPSAATPSTADGVRRVAPRTPPATRRFDHAIRTSVIALVVAAIAYVASNFVDLAVFVVLLWLLAAVSLVVAVVDAFRGRRRALTHPDRVRGAWLASFALVFAIAGIVGLTVSVLAVTTDDPADAPVDLTDLSAVQVARWGYQRTSLLADNGWHQVARADGTCWSNEWRRKARSEDRVESTKENVSDSCGQSHSLEVVKVFAFDRDADSPYPGPDKILVAAQGQCGDLFAKIQKKTPAAKPDVEYPTEVGWADADHDIACTVSTDAERTGKLNP